MRRTLSPLLACVAAVCAVCAFATDALAQSPAPAEPSPVSAVTPQVAVVSLVMLVAAFLAQGVNTGKIGTLVTVPTAWIPRLIAVLGFLVPFGASLQGASSLSGAASFNAVFAGAYGLLHVGAGAALQRHTSEHLEPAAKAKAAAKAVGLLMLLLGLGRVLSACTPAQGATATTVVNAIFSADQAACLAANEGLVGDSNAVQEFKTTCNLVGPFDQAITTFIGDITQNPTAMARVTAERKAAGK